MQSVGRLYVIPSKTGGLLVFMSSLLILSLYAEIRHFNTRMYLRQQFSTRNVVTSWIILWVYSMIYLIIIGGAMPQTVYIIYGRLASVGYIVTSLAVCLY